MTRTLALGLLAACISCGPPADVAPEPADTAAADPRAIEIPADTPVVPALPPTEAPDSIFCPRDEAGTPIDLVFVAFYRRTPHSDRVRVIRSIGGLVVGGERTEIDPLTDGFYYVRVDSAAIHAIEADLQSLPEVQSGGRVIFLVTPEQQGMAPCED